MAFHFYNDHEETQAANSPVLSTVAFDSYAIGAAAVFDATGTGSAAILLARVVTLSVFGQLYGDVGILGPTSTTQNADSYASRISVGAGALVFGNSYGILLQSSHYTVDNAGDVYGGYTAMSVDDPDTVTNEGLISGTITGLTLSHTTTSYAGTLTNSGGIVGGFDAVDLEGSVGIAFANSGSLSAQVAVRSELTTGSVTLDNSGSIVGGRFALESAFGSSAAWEVHNRGTISGDVKLSAGDDVFDTSGGGFAGTAFGGAGDDQLTGSGAGDRLDGGAGADDLDGGDGFDMAVYADAAAGVVASLAAPSLNTGDALGDSFASIEGLTGSAFADTLTGDGGANRLVGGGGNDILDGGAGADAMRGGAGGDTYLVDTAGDRVFESADGGADTVFSSVDFTLPANVETLVLTGHAVTGTGNDLANHLTGTATHNVLSGGFGDDVIDGGAGADTISGGDGSDTLDGGTAADTMNGGAGRDIYVVDNARDVVIEDTPGNSILETDQVLASVTYTLPVNVENLTLTGSADLSAFGNAGNNSLTGNSGANLLDAGMGADVMAGGGGADRFRFSTAPDGSANVDDILDFTSGTDKLLFSRAMFSAFTQTGAVDSAAFAVGSAAQTPDQHLIYDPSGGSLFYDADGSGGADQVLVAVLGLFSTHPTITAADLLIVG